MKLQDWAREFREMFGRTYPSFDRADAEAHRKYWDDVMTAFARQVAREERERCAKVCDKMLEQEGNNSEVHKRRCHAVDAATIRSLRDVP